MKVKIDRSFEKDLRNISSPKMRHRLADLIERVQAAEAPEEIPHLTKIQGFDAFYRIRLGDYWVGVEIAGHEVTFLRVLHRKEIYRYFP